jgi:hypothetical protein
LENLDAQTLWVVHYNFPHEFAYTGAGAGRPRVVKRVVKDVRGRGFGGKKERPQGPYLHRLFWWNERMLVIKVNNTRPPVRPRFSIQQNRVELWESD